MEELKRGANKKGPNFKVHKSGHEWKTTNETCWKSEKEQRVLKLVERKLKRFATRGNDKEFWRFFESECLRKKKRLSF